MHVSQKHGFCHIHYNIKVRACGIISSVYVSTILSCGNRSSVMDIVAHCWILCCDTCGHCGQEVSAGNEEKAISEWKQEGLIMLSQKHSTILATQYFISKFID